MTIVTAIDDNCGINESKSDLLRGPLWQAPGLMTNGAQSKHKMSDSVAPSKDDAGRSAMGLRVRNFKPKSDLRCACRCPLHVQPSCAWQCRMVTLLRMASDEEIAPRRSEDSS